MVTWWWRTLRLAGRSRRPASDCSAAPPDPGSAPTRSAALMMIQSGRRSHVLLLQLTIRQCRGKKAVDHRADIIALTQSARPALSRPGSVYEVTERADPVERSQIAANCQLHTGSDQKIGKPPFLLPERERFLRFRQTLLPAL